MSQRRLNSKTLGAGLLMLAACSCGYHVAGTADMLPENIQTIAVPPFTNGTTEFKIEQYMTAAVVDELISRTRYRVVSDAPNADARLQGSVVGFYAVPSNYDPITQRATSVTIVANLSVTLWDSRSGQAIYQNPNLEHRGRYEVSVDPDVYFEERQAAIVRSSETMARTLVSAVLEGF